jgi:hypothetical protein
MFNPDPGSGFFLSQIRIQGSQKSTESRIRIRNNEMIKYRYENC